MSKVMEHKSFLKGIIMAIGGICVYYFTLISFDFFVPLILLINKKLRVLHLSRVVLDILFDAPFIIMFCLGAFIINLSIKEKQFKYFFVYIFFFYTTNAYFFLQAVGVQSYMLTSAYLVSLFFNTGITVLLGCLSWKIGNTFGLKLAKSKKEN